MNIARPIGLRLLGVLVVGTVSLAACGGGGSESSGETRDELKIATEVDLGPSDNLMIREANDRLVMGSTVFEPLFTSDTDGKPSPALAKKATPSKDQKTWTMDLQDGVKFQNGKDFTADDVKATFEGILDPDNASALAGDFENIDTIEVVDPVTVRFHLKVPDSQLSGRMTDTAFIADMDARDKAGEDGWTQHPIGTGPYEWDTRAVGDNITFKRFDAYWRGTPPLSKVIFKVIPDATTATLALENGDVDVMTNFVSTEALADLKKDPDFQVLSESSNTFYNAFLIFAPPRVDDYQDTLAFHQGLAYLFNAQEIVPAVVGDFGTYANQPIPEWQDGHDPDLEPYPFDPDKGIALLTQAGFPPGSTLKFVVRNSPSLCEVATAIQSQIEQLDYKVDLTCTDAEAAGNGPEYKWDVLFTRSSGRVSAAAYFNDRWRKSLAQAKDDYYTFENDELEQVIADMPQQTSVDAANELARKAAQIIVKEQVADIPLYHANTFVIASKDVQGLVLSPLGWQSMLMNSYTTVKLAS